MDKKQVRPELCPFEVPFLDDFDLDVDELVISVYKSTIDGIDRLDKKRSAELKAEEDEEAHPQMISIWEYSVQRMKYHAGNMALVSLLSLFDDWLGHRAGGKDWKSRFQTLIGRYREEGPLSLDELEAMVIARNSIIHHSGQSNYTWNTPHQVEAKFLQFDEIYHDDRVGLEEPLLASLCKELKAQVAFWNEKDKAAGMDKTRGSI